MRAPEDNGQHPDRHTSKREPSRDGARGGTGADAEDSVERVTRAEPEVRALLHELAGLVDGSVRYLRLARRAIEEDGETEVDAVRMLDGAMRSLDRLASVITHRGPLQSGKDATRWLAGAFGTQAAHQAIDAAVEHLAPLAATKDVRIETMIEADAIAAAPACLYPAIANGLRNAIEASPTGGIVEVLATVAAVTPRDGTEPGDGRQLVITISDRGTSLTTIDPERAFVLGYTTKPSGSGVGLPLSRSLVEHEGGSLTLTHDHAAHVTEFVIRLPLPAPHSDPMSRRVG